MLYAIVAVLVIIVDQWVKYWVAGTISMASTGEAFIPGVISLVNLHNDGAAFSFLSGGGARIYFIIITGVFTVAVILALATNFISGRLARWSIVMVTAGGLSNCIDRIIYGYVQDMFKVELFDFAVFNVADIFITVFAILFALAIIFGKNPEPDEDNALFEEDYEQVNNAPSVRRKAKERDYETEEKKSKAFPKKAKYQDEYEQYKAARAARQKQAASASAPASAPRRPVSPSAPAQAPVRKAPAYDPADPFAEWERANARVEAQQMNSVAARAAGINPAPASRPAAADPSAPVERRPMQNPAPAAPAQPAKSTSDIDLEDILAEFK